MVFKRTETSHKFFRTPSRILCNQNLLQEQVVAHVKLLMDNVSAVAYINKMGGTHSQTIANLAIDLWNWCLDHKIHVSAEYLPGVLKLRTDRESQVITDSSDWKLNPAFFKILVQK